jgi:Putative MetA-pathway of phenol degradation
MPHTHSRLPLFRGVSSISTRALMRPGPRGLTAAHSWQRHSAVGALAVAALVVCAGLAQATDCPGRSEGIATDRPDTTNSSVVVPTGSVQAENGVNVSAREGTRTFDLTETRVRLGLWRCGEVLVDLPTYFTGSTTSSIVSDPIASVKQQLFTKWQSFSLSAVAGIGLPVGTPMGDQRTFSPYVQFPWSQAIAGAWAVNGQLTMTWSTARNANDPNVQTTLVIEREFGETGDLFLEYIGDYSKRERASQSVDIGGGWHVTSNQQIDFHLGVGLTPNAPDYFVGLGYSVRIDGLLGRRGNRP